MKEAEAFDVADTISASCSKYEIITYGLKILSGWDGSRVTLILVSFAYLIYFGFSPVW